MNLRLKTINSFLHFRLFLQAELLFVIGRGAFRLGDIIDTLVEIIGTRTVDNIESEKVQTIIMITFITTDSPMLLKECRACSKSVNNQIAHSIISA